ncbi:MAG: hypothetical protein ABIH23_27450 [bacterium]
MDKALLLVTLSISLTLGADRVGFRSAKPVWPKGRQKEKNLFVGFRTVFQAPKGKRVTFRVTASTLYRFFLNGEFRGHGPARGPHGYFRVDEWDLTEYLQPGKNLIAVEVAGYNVNSFYLLDRPSFLQAEVVSEGKVLASTGRKGKSFEAGILKERVQKVQRYSFQRPFSEVYRLRKGHDLWRKDASAPFDTVRCSTLRKKSILPRGVPYPKFHKKEPVWNLSCGTIQSGVPVDKLWKDRSLTGIGPKLGGFPEEDLKTVPSIELQQISTVSKSEINRPYSPETQLSFAEDSFHILDFGTNLTGFLGATITCHKPTRIFLTFDEILSDGDVDFKRLSCVNIVGYRMKKGTYSVESFEPYTLRYLKVIVLEGECEVENIYLREYVNPEVSEAHFAASDKRLNQLFEAGRETFRQNAVDIFMDCPSRERAGWLCDSFFTARVAQNLSGNAAIERNFFENFLLPDTFAHLPEGMLPMCYPADHYDGVFIPNWSLWFVLQLEEYLERSGDRQLADALKPKLLRLFDYFKPFINEDGLLEKLKSWVFVEWSDANKFVQDVNYPTNMLYAAALDAAGRMYNLPDLQSQAENLREVIRRQSFDGQFFVDNAVRENGNLQVTENRTEVCQYFAFFFDIATPSTHETLWQTLCGDFGPKRKRTKKYPEVREANAFVGNMLRLEILSRYGRCQQILDESISYLLYMAELTGTLWENVGTYASCNHGFASHVVRTLYRDVLGLYEVDSVNRSVNLRFSDLRLNWCEGRIPVEGGAISFRWWKKGESISYRISVPAGYTVNAENLSDNELIRVP